MPESDELAEIVTDRPMKLGPALRIESSQVDVVDCKRATRWRDDTDTTAFLKHQRPGLNTVHGHARHHEVTLHDSFMHQEPYSARGAAEPAYGAGEAGRSGLSGSRWLGGWSGVVPGRGDVLGGVRNIAGLDRALRPPLLQLEPCTTRSG